MWPGIWPHSVAWGRTVCVCVCVRKYSQTFVIYVIRSVNSMMAARRIGFTLLKTANSSNSNSGCGYVQAKLHRRRLLSRTCAPVGTMDRANFLPFKLLFIGVKLVEQVKRSAAASASAAGSPNCFSFYGQSKYQIKFAMQPACFPSAPLPLCLSCLRLND